MLPGFSQGFLRLTRFCLAPKKKPTKGGETVTVEKSAPGLDHVFNIYAGGEDQKILPDHKYPAWLFELDKPQKTFGEMEAMFVYGNDIENATLHDYRRFLRHTRKISIKLNNRKLAKRPATFETKLVN